MFRFKWAAALVILFAAMMVSATSARAWTYESPNANAQGASTPTAYTLSHISVTGGYLVGRLAVPIHTATGLVHGRIAVYDLSDNNRLIYSFTLNRSVTRAQKVWVEISPSTLSLQNGHEYAIGFEPGSNFYGSVYYNDNRPSTVADVTPYSAIQTLGTINRNFVTSDQRSSGLRLELMAGMISTPPVLEGDVEEIPTLTEWAMIGFALALAGGAVLMIQRRRRLV